MNRFIRFVMLLVSLTIALASLTSVSSAQAETAFCSGANQSIDPVSGNCVTSTLTEGQLQASVNESLKGKAYLDLVTSGKVMLNVHTQPIPKQLINRCWKVKPGTVVLNTVVDPMTGQTKIIRWVVPVGDNTFCTEKGHGHQVFKKSCGNKEYNVPGQPHQPRPPKAITRGRFTVVNYVKWEAVLLAMLSKHLAGSLSVESPDHTCQASASFDNDVLAKIYLKAVFKSRTKVAARATGAKKILMQAQTGTKASGKMAYAIKLTIKNKLSAMCNTSVPPSLPLPPTVSASAKGCVGPDNPTTQVDVSAADTNKDDTSVTFVFDSQPSKTVQLLSGQASATFTVNAAGSYSGHVTGNPSGLSAAFSVPVNPCDTPVVPAPDVTLDTMNQVIETKSATTGLAVQVYGGDTATVTISTLWGQIYTTKTFNNVSGSWNTTIGYTAPGEIPDGSQSFPDTPPPPAGSDQVRVVVVDNQTGKKVVAYTNVKITAYVPAP